LLLVWSRIRNESLPRWVGTIDLMLGRPAELGEHESSGAERRALAIAQVLLQLHVVRVAEVGLHVAEPRPDLAAGPEQLAAPVELPGEQAIGVDGADRRARGAGGRRARGGLGGELLRALGDSADRGRRARRG
jgi:hypothetical protein